MPQDLPPISGAQRLSGRGLTRDRGVAGSSLIGVTALCPWARHTNPSLVMVQPRKTRPYLTEILLMGRKESNQTNKPPISQNLRVKQNKYLLPPSVVLWVEMIQSLELIPKLRGCRCVPMNPLDYPHSSLRTPIYHLRYPAIYKRCKQMRN